MTFRLSYLFRPLFPPLFRRLFHRLFPISFPACYEGFALLGLALLLFFSVSLERGSLRHRVSLLLVSLSVIISLYVNFRLFPEAERVKQQVHSFEAAPDDPARAAFRRLHAQSAVLNLLMIADGLALLLMNAGIKNRE